MIVFFFSMENDLHAPYCLAISMNKLPDKNRICQGCLTTTKNAIFDKFSINFVIK